MGTILRGAVTGLGESFGFPRSYVLGFAISWPAGGVSTLTDREWRVTLGSDYGNAYKRMVFKSEFFTWNSNFYTFGWIFEDFYVVVPPNPPQAAEGFNLRYKARPGTHDMYLAMDDGFWTNWYYVLLPPAPSTYWMRNPG